MAKVKERGGGGEKGRMGRFPSFKSPSPLFHFLALVSFIARSKPKVPFLSISLLRNQTETLATQASLLSERLFVFSEKSRPPQIYVFELFDADFLLL